MDESPETVPENEHSSKFNWEREKVYKLIELVEASVRNLPVKYYCR